MRFLTVAVLSLRREVLPGEGVPRCDGKTVVFHADSVLADYRGDANLVCRQLAHCVMHCMLGHTGASSEERMLAEDMIAEYVLDSLNGPSVRVEGRDDRMYACEKTFRAAGAPLPDLVEAELKNSFPWRITLYSRMFTRDDGAAHGEDTPEWREIALQAMTEVEGFVKRTGGGTDAFLSILRIRNRKRHDYRAFLRKFMTRRNTVHEDIDEFDPIFYTYGLRVYGNMPLVDSVETSDRARVEDLVIAIDTSGSTMRGPVEAFLEEALSVVRQSGMGGRLNIHVVQCDDEVRSDDVIRSEADLHRLASSFRLRGGGSTDFRPVFKYVDDLVETGELRKLRGLMYFTDGLGTYPERRPAYDTAFVFCDDTCAEREVPPWAMRISVRTSDLAGDRE